MSMLLKDHRAISHLMYTFHLVYIMLLIVYIFMKGLLCATICFNLGETTVDRRSWLLEAGKGKQMVDGMKKIKQAKKDPAGAVR